jgi:hypothetical protein
VSWVNGFTPDFFSDLPSPTACPSCGLNAPVYVRLGSELVCVDCKSLAGAGEASFPPSRPRPRQALGVSA